ncbi:MAG: cyclic nucleotide-binding domain-containing protein [Deltaproteobacteria bacterium]|nr:cyclic nucleotide-binding domain-containing protein [Deltaproteobacteria bacterium]
MAVTNKFLWLDLFSRKSESEITILSTLKSNQLFVKLTNRELAYVSKTVHIRTYDPGEVVFEQYEKGLGMYMIAKGAIDIKLRGNDKTENEILVTTLTPGSFFGELALIDTDNKRSASAYAQGPTTLIGFFKPDLLEIMERKPETGVKILFQLSKVLGRRLNETTELIASMSREKKAS